MRAQRIYAVVRKEFLHIRRDSRSLAMALLMPLTLLLLFGYALTLDVDRLPTLIYDMDRSPQSRELLARFEGSQFFEVVGRAERYEVLEQAIDSSRVTMGVVIPFDYSKRILAGQRAHVQVILDGSDSNTASIALGYVESVIARHARRLAEREQERKAGASLKPIADTRIRVLYNREMKSRNYIVPGLIAVILMIIAALLTSLTIAKEWEMGTMEQVLSTPLRPAEIALAKMLAYAAIAVVDVVLCIMVGIFIFRVPMRGSVLLLGVACVLFLVGTLFWGIFLSAALRSQLRAYQAAMVTGFLPAFLLSGFVFAIETMPQPIQVISHLIPARYFIVILKGIFLKGVGLEILGLEFLLLAVYAIVVFLLATRKLRQKVA